MIARHIVARLLETFFRRWWLYLLPLVALIGLGVYTARNKADTYQSTAVLSVARATLLGELQDVGGNESLASETPSQRTSRQINESLHTDDFVARVRAAAGIPADSLVVTLEDVRTSLRANAGGQSLLAVSATTVDAQLAQRLVESTINTYIQDVIDNQVLDSTTTLNYLKERLAEYEVEKEQATNAMLAYLVDHNAPFGGDDRPVEEQFAIDELASAVTRANDRLSGTLDNIDAAQLRIEQATSDAAQTVRVVDPPTLPTHPETGTRDVVITVATFGALGMLLLLGGVVAASLLDRSLRYAEEVRSSLGVEVLAVVPVEPRGKSRRRRRALT